MESPFSCRCYRSPANKIELSRGGLDCIKSCLLICKLCCCWWLETDKKGHLFLTWLLACLSASTHVCARVARSIEAATDISCPVIDPVKLLPTEVSLVVYASNLNGITIYKEEEEQTYSIPVTSRPSVQSGPDMRGTFSFFNLAPKATVWWWRSKLQSFKELETKSAILGKYSLGKMKNF